MSNIKHKIGAGEQNDLYVVRRRRALQRARRDGTKTTAAPRDQLSVNSSSQKPLKSVPNSSTRILTGAKVIWTFLYPS